MAKKELRLAVVIYGGASLAVYMHGVSKELLKLIRASKVLHEMGPERAARLPYREGPDRRPSDTEAVYFDLLSRINEKGNFRVVVDVLAGASAGAINGVMMAKALVDDALLDSQTGGWLADADADHLSAGKTGPLRKWYLYPFLKALSFWLPRDIAGDPETRGKIARLVRKAWFQPPFSGERLCHHFFDALETMGETRRAGSSLLPPGQRLDVYASLTDLAGYPRTIRLHEQLVAQERAHAVFCQLTHVATESGRQSSDFHDDNLPGLVWAARGSSSYAGAFPPFHHSEMKRVLAERQRLWPREADFLSGSVRLGDGSAAFRHFDPADRYFVDGGIVNNKPFGAAMEALNHRAADRQVERCLVYIEPDPSLELANDPARDLGYLSTIRAALSSIPRNQPILDDLNQVVAQDARVQVNRRIIEAHRGKIERMVAALQADYAGQALNADLVTRLRRGMLEQAERSMGLAFDVYVQRRVWRLVEALVQAWSDLSAQPVGSVLSRGMEDSLAAWWRRDGAAAAVDAGSGRSGRDRHQEAFLERFDVTFRIRRLQFLIRRMNQHEDERHMDDAARAALEGFKEQAYGFMERFYALRRSDGLEDELVLALADALTRLPLPADDALALLERLAGWLDLGRVDQELDATFFAFLDRLDSAELRDTLLGDYVGFPVYDVLLLAPGSLEGGPDPLTPIRVERISPADADSLSSIFGGLRCRNFMGFVGFFNRGYREHDYLWGRLNAAERLVDLLVSAAGEAIDDPAAWKRALFRSILERERRRLHRVDDQLDALARFLDDG